MSYNLPPVQSNQPKFFARQGTRVLTTQATLSNLDEAPTQPLFNVNPVKTTPKLNKLPTIPSLPSLEQFDRPPMFTRPDETTPNKDNRHPLDQPNRFAPPGFVVPQGNGLLRIPLGGSNKKMNVSSDAMQQNMNMYGFQPPRIPAKNISYSEGGTPKAYEYNPVGRPLLQPTSLTPVAYSNNNLLPNVYARPYNILVPQNASFEHLFERRLEDQHKLLDKLMLKLEKEANDSDGEPDELEKLRKKELARQMQVRRKKKIHATMMLQQFQQPRFVQIMERGEAEEYSPNIPYNQRGHYTNRRQNVGTYNYIEDNSPQSSRHHNPNHRNKDDRIYKSMNELGDGLVSRRKLKKGKGDDSSDEEYGMSRSPRKKDAPKKTVKTRPNIMGHDYEPSIQFMSRRGRKDLAQARLRIVSWSLVYYHLLYNSVKKRVLAQRDLFLRTISEDIFALSGIIEAYVLQTSGKQIQEMISNKNCDFLFVSEKLQPAKKLDKECETLFISYKNILDRLFTFTKTLPDHLFGLIATISEEGSQLPHDYFTEFELKRQQFTYFGKLKFVTSAKSKLIIGGVLLRVLLNQVIMKPWDVFKMEADKIDRDRLLNIGSLLYNVIMDVLKGLVPIFHHNQSFLSVDLKVKPKRTLLQALDLTESEQKFNVKKEEGRDGDIMEGFYSKQQLGCFFNDRKKYIDDLKSLVYGWLDCIYESSHEEAIKKADIDKKAITDKPEKKGEPEK